MPTMDKYVFSFGAGCETPPKDRALLGGKGVGEVEMVSMNLPVPPGFIISTEACVYYRNNRHKSPESLWVEVVKGIQTLEVQTGCKFGNPDCPLLISVRSGARVSMPGMMETILDLGLNDQTVIGFSKKMGGMRLAYDSYRRFIQMYSSVVKEIPAKLFEDVLTETKRVEKVSFDVELSAEALKAICTEFKEIYKNEAKSEFPMDVNVQLKDAVEAVFRSWDCPKAISYRRFHNFSDDWGTAVVVMLMVFGNRNEQSATGVGFTRDPSSGVKRFYGEFLLNAQGEDVVAGIRTPQPVNAFQKELQGTSLKSLEEEMPQIYAQLLQCAHTLENRFKDMQDIEFTVDDGTLYMLQTRAGKRTGMAALKIALDMLDEGLIDEKGVLKLIEPDHVTQLLTPTFSIGAKTRAAHKKAGRGIPAGAGAACGRAAFSSAKALDYSSQKVKCVLVREETSPEDFPGLVAASGVLTLKGGATSHAAVVARGMGKSCVCGCSTLTQASPTSLRAPNGDVLSEGDMVSIDGTTGQVYFCELEADSSEIVKDLLGGGSKGADLLAFERLMKICNVYRKLKVYANADNRRDCEVANHFGSEGVGLCRTEHMFMSSDRLFLLRKALFAPCHQTRLQAANSLVLHQKQDFKQIFAATQNRPVTIRLLDPPRHEFLPHSDEERKVFADALGMSLEREKELEQNSKENNPMLGHRGCRLGITYPHITQAQVRAILEAAIEVQEENPTFKMEPGIMIPVVMCEREVMHQKALIEEVSEQVFSEKGKRIGYKIGTMIELPRACLLAASISPHVSFFSFGTNDLTQCTLGISRDDAGAFLPDYIKGMPFAPDGNKYQIFEFDPFATLDKSGVGELMAIAKLRGTSKNGDLQTGVCGEHGGDASSVAFCYRQGQNYVSCSPYRIPVAIFAAARATVMDF